MTGAQRQHRMPFGAELLEDGGVCFRLWAPAAEHVDVCLNTSADSHQEPHRLMPMLNQAQGWFSLSTEQASAGSLYRFRIDGDLQIPDPASRFQPFDVHGPSEVIDPTAHEWRHHDWRGRPWEESVIYELHPGSFTAEGNLCAVEKKLDYLVDLGITAIELMPVADFPGRRNWGYDGVYLFAVDSRYGRPGDMKALIDAAHGRNLMVFLDVVYNHFGPEGNYLHRYAPQFFSRRHQTPWGAAINYDGEDSYWVRQFFIHNALHWLEEYQLDGLRFDAVHAILDDSQPDILTELADRVRERFDDTRHVHLVLENDHNAARYLARDAADRPQWYVAQWNDDIHHAMHLLLSGEADGYYMDYADDPLRHLGRCLNQGFAYQGETSAYRDHTDRGEPSGHLPPLAFVSFLQNHDQVGNRAYGERITRLATAEAIHAALALLLLAPQPPLLFMGQEWGCRQPFAFFCDFGADLAQKVVEGRRQEFAHFPEFSDPAARSRIPDPQDPHTFEHAVLDWTACEQPEHRRWLELHRDLLRVRQRYLTPRLAGTTGGQPAYTRLAERALKATWILGDGSELMLWANLGDDLLNDVQRPREQILYATHDESLTRPDSGRLPPWSVIWYLHTMQRNL